LTKANLFRTQEDYLFLDELEALIQKGEQHPVFLKELKYLQMHAKQARDFRYRAAKLFLKSNSLIDLVEVS